jgi:hypothetical protein
MCERGTSRQRGGAMASGLSQSQTHDPRITAVVALMRTWNCFEPLRAGALEELAANVVATVDLAKAGTIETPSAMPSDLTPRERAITALYGPHCNLAFIQPGAMTEAVESAIVAAVAAERERCAAAVMRILSGKAAAPIVQEICAVSPAGRNDA